MADYVQSIPTPDGELFFNAENSPSDRHYTASEFAETFKESKQYKRILERLEKGTNPNKWISKHKQKSSRKDEEEANVENIPKEVPKQFKMLYQNSFFRSLKLNFKRHLTLWMRDKGFIIGTRKKRFRGSMLSACTHFCPCRENV